jgi:hypothetical protein
MLIGYRRELGADALPEGKASIDRFGRLLPAWGIEVVAGPDLAEPSLQRQ